MTHDMTTIVQPINLLVSDELDRASKIHGETFASAHEGFGVIAEELQEVGDELEIVGPDLRPFSFTAQNIRDEEGNPLEEPRHPEMKFTMQLPKAVPALSMIRRSVDLSAK